VESIQIAFTAGYNRTNILNLSSIIRILDSGKTPPNKDGRLQNITPIILETPYEHLIEKSNFYLHEIAIFSGTNSLFKHQYQELVFFSVFKGWSKMANRIKTRENSQNLCNENFYFISNFQLHYPAYVDKSDCDKRIDLRQTN